MGHENPIFSVFTAAFNAEKTLARVYESLLGQTFCDFEWIVVDDGSTDETRKLIARWQESGETGFTIQYIYQQNQHKKAAHNRALELARGEFFLPLDADDRCTAIALETFYEAWRLIPENVRNDFVGVCGLCQYENGQIVGNIFPGMDYFDASPQELLHRYRVKGEKWGFNRIDILKEFLFREDIPGYVPESIVWEAIGRRYKTRFINKPLRIYYQESQQEKARLATKLKRLSEPGRLAHKKEKLNKDLTWFFKDPVYFIKDAVWVGRFSLHADRKQRGFVKLNNPIALMLVCMAFPVAVAVFWKDRLDGHLLR